ncbi:MAG: restriction endonuclease subunit S, partial [Verrucomicrobiota bacterium]
MSPCPIEKLGNVSKVINGGTPKTSVPAFWDGDHKWITPAEMGKRMSPFASITKRTLTDKGLGKRKLLPPYSVILSSRAPIGHLVINEVPMTFNQGCKGIIPSEALQYKFLYYFLLRSVEHLDSLGTGATFKELSATNLKNLPIPVPPLPEQERIVAKLDEAFAAIATASDHTRRKLQNARDLFQSTLHSTFQQKGKDWVEKIVKDLCDNSRVITYGVIKLGDHIPNGIPCLRTSNVRHLRIDTYGMKIISFELSNSYSRTILKGGEVLVNVRGTLGGVAKVPSEMAGWNISREVAMIPADDSKINSDYLAYWIATKDSQDWLTGVKKGAAYTGIMATSREMFHPAISLGTFATPPSVP